MLLHEHCTEFAGYRVVDFDPEKGIPTDGTICRLRAEPEYGAGCLFGFLVGSSRRAQKKHLPPDLLEAFLASPGASGAPGLVIGASAKLLDGQEQAATELIAVKDRLTGLRALFLFDIVQEECEISWLVPGEIGPLLEAYHELEHLKVRGGPELKKPVSHKNLRSLAFESGGLSSSLIRAVLTSQIPSLEHLEFWFGDKNYGGDTKVEDLEPLWGDNLFPNLRYLGLRNASFSDEIAKKLASSRIIERIEELDLSLGTLGDEGARALLDCPSVRKLKMLDLHHHYISPELIEALKEFPMCLNLLNTGNEHEDPKYGRFVAVSE